MTALHDIYEELFTILTRWPGGTRLLFYATQNGHRMDRPSWIPDLEMSHQACCLPYRRGVSRTSPDALDAPEISMCPSDSRICVRGGMWGVVRWVSDEFAHAPPAQDEPLPTLDLHNIKQIREPWRRFYLNYGNNTVCRRYSSPMWISSRQMGREVADSVIDWTKMGSIDQNALESWCCWIDPKRKHDFVEADMKRLQVNTRLMRCHARICNLLASEKRCLFLCESVGRLRIGNGPVGLRPCDRLVRITKTLNDPLLAVRRQSASGSYRVIGSVFLDKLFYKGDPCQDFELRHKVPGCMPFEDITLS